MYRFEHSAPLDTTVYPEPAAEDRSGPPLTQGTIYLLMDTVASDYCTPEMQDALEEIEPTEWYHGQLLETILNHFEDENAERVIDIGKNIYYTLQHQFMEMGLRTPADVIKTMPMLWLHVTRGDSGVWRSELISDHEGIVEMEQPYNCHFEQGALQGALECFDAKNVQIDHSQCMRNGAPYCRMVVTWNE